jgi:phosphatidylglycerol lysyltransferase
MVRENRKLIAQFFLTALFIVLGTWFFKHERAELREVKSVLFSSQWEYVLAGIGLTIFYLVAQASMYKFAFAAVGSKMPLSTTILLFLKRNFISIFIPAGGVTSLAFFTGDAEKEGATKTKIHFASSIYAFVGIATVVVVSIPIFLYAMFDGLTGKGEWLALAFMVCFVVGLFLAYRSIMSRGKMFRLITRFVPASEIFLDDLLNHTIDTRYLVYTIINSFIIDFSCIAMLYIGMLALGIHPVIFYALLGYVTTVVLLFVSPFMRGLGAVEVSLSFVLTRFGYTNVEAVAITFMYRFFEFWLPLLAGALSFLLKINKLLVRIVPALLIFILGIINIISVITPAIHERVQRLSEFIPLDAIAASNYLVLMAGIFMLLTAVFLLKGLRNSWWIALVLSLVSFVGHLTKAIDYEESTVALLVFVMLLFSRKEYHIRGNPRMHTIGIWTALLSIAAVLAYGTVGFYFLDKKYFGIEFNAFQSLRYSIQYFLLAGSTDLVTTHRFAKDFLISINISGFLSMSFLFYTILRPYIFKGYADPEGFTRAKELVEKYGLSGMDYFKTYSDKLIFAPADLEAFIAYRVAGNYAVVLEDPVAENAGTRKQCISLFDEYCFEHGLKSIYYRVPEESLSVYRELSKKSLFLGQEAVVDLTSFTLEGGKNKALRNAINKLNDRGFKSTVHMPPIKDGLIQKLKAVSDEWLNSNDRKEIIFSQGMFVWEELKQQTIITVENAEEMVIAFLNIIPDYAPGEATYDLIRKTDESPHGVLDFILIEMFRYLKSQNYSRANLGFAPMSGMEKPDTFGEKSMKFAYEKIKSFSHYKGLRYFKEKFFPTWHNKYLIYSDDYDLLQVPAVLNRVIKVDHD